jgi:hypothetical protein
MHCIYLKKHFESAVTDLLPHVTALPGRKSIKFERVLVIVRRSNQWGSMLERFLDAVICRQDELINA